MRLEEKDLLDFVGSVNILLYNRIVLQGQIEKEKRHHDDINNINVNVENGIKFITVKLNCDAFTLEENDLETIHPTLYQEGYVVKINVSQISVIGPSHKCPGECENKKKCKT